MMPNKSKTKPPKAVPKGKPDSSLGLMQLNNKIDGLMDLIANLSGRVQQQDTRINQNWTRFVFHDHRRVDLSGPQFFNQDYEQQFMLQQKAQAEAQARARGEQKPPKPAVPPTDSPPSEK